MFLLWQALKKSEFIRLYTCINHAALISWVFFAAYSLSGNFYSAKGLDVAVYISVFFIFSQLISFLFSALIFCSLKLTSFFPGREDIFEKFYPVLSSVSKGAGFFAFVFTLDRIFIDQNLLNLIHVNESFRIYLELLCALMIFAASVLRGLKRQQREQEPPKHEQEPPKHEQEPPKHEQEPPKHEQEPPKHEQEPPKHEQEQVPENSVGRRLFIASAFSAMAGATIGVDVARKLKFPLEVKGQSENKNFLLITFDALTAQDMSTYGYYLGTTPNIDQFSKSADVYNNFYACSTFTTPGIASILTGRYPSNTHVYQLGSMLYGADVFRTLPAVLKVEGYQTASVFGNPYAMPLMQTTCGAFDHITCPSIAGLGSFPPAKIQGLPGVTEVLNIGIRLSGAAGLVIPPLQQRESLHPPAATFAAAKEILSELKEPYFVWIHVMAPHAPYLPSEEFRYRFLPHGQFDSRQDMMHPRVLATASDPSKIKSDIQKIRLRYDEWILEADSAFGDFISDMESSGALTNTVTIVSADHGELFSDRDYGHGGGQFHRSLIHIPMIVKTPHQTAGRRINTVADQTSIAPTILDLAGIPIPNWMQGKSLSKESIAGSSQELTSSMAFSQYFSLNSSFEPVTKGTIGAVSDRFQYVRDLSSGQEGLYPIASTNESDAGSDIKMDMKLTLESMRDSVRVKFPEIKI